MDLSYPVLKQDDEYIELKTHVRKTSSSSSVVDGLARGFYGGTTELVERLQAQVRQKDGEIKLLHVSCKYLQILLICI